tara:strand:- start:642 stop:809 length:168 start_codon:yes stop_codon:yes gene_type:complete
MIRKVGHRILTGDTSQSMVTRDLGRGFGRLWINVGGMRRSTIVEPNGGHVVLGSM